MFLTEASFQLKVEEIVQVKRLSYMDAVLHFCEENNMDPSDISKIVSSNLKEKIRLDAIEDGLMKKTAVLPI
jgi:hypothetical protein